MTLRDIIASLENTYCSHVGVEYTHIQDQECRMWLQERIESTRLRPAFSKPLKTRILRRVYKAELFEKFLHTKYVGQKRFSLEGGETIIAALDTVIDHCPDVGVEEIVMGMTHRGRHNVLCSVMRKSFDELFEQFSENYIPDTVGGDGDVKYHLGYESVLTTTSGKKVEVRLAANPSHLEIVDPVVEGKTRARQRIRGDTEERRRVLALLIHGDAALAGQGIVAETLNFSQLPGYRTGGTVHLVINNQIGFTTDPRDARSTRYCTDVAKMIEAPIFHVNGDDPEAVCMVSQLALDFRVRFKRTSSSTCTASAGTGTTRPTSLPSRSRCSTGRSRPTRWSPPSTPTSWSPRGRSPRRRATRSGKGIFGVAGGEPRQGEGPRGDQGRQAGEAGRRLQGIDGGIPAGVPPHSGQHRGPGRRDRAHSSAG